MLGIGDVAIAASQPGERTGAAFFGDLVVHGLHELGIVKDHGGLVHGGEAVGQIEDTGCGGKGGQIATGEHGQMDFSRTQLLDIGLLITHGAADEFLHFNFAAAFLFHDFGKFVDGQNMQAAVGIGGGGTDGHGFVVGSKGFDLHEYEGQGTEGQNEFLHTILRRGAGLRTPR